MELIERIFELDFSEIYIPPTQQLVLLHLAYQANESGYVSLSMSELTRKCNCSRPTISQALKGLVSCGLIEVDTGKAGKTNSYRITLGKADYDFSDRPQRSQKLQAHSIVQPEGTYKQLSDADDTEVDLQSFGVVERPSWLPEGASLEDCMRLSRSEDTKPSEEDDEQKKPRKPVNQKNVKNRQKRKAAKKAQKR